MGSQSYVTPEFGCLLGHPFNPDQRWVEYVPDSVSAVSIGTSTAKIKLGGSHVEGTSANYVVPSWCRNIVAVQPITYMTTPTADQGLMATLKIESADLKMGDYEVFANPLGGALGTTVSQWMDSAPWYPLGQPTNGSEQVQFYGTAQIANTVAPLMSVNLLLSDTYPEGYSLQSGWASGYNVVQAKIAGINSGGGPTATGTAAASVATDGGLTINGPKKRLIALYSIVESTTPAASKPFGGQIQAVETAFNVTPLSMQIEPIQGFLGTTTTADVVHITRKLFNVPMRTPANPKSSFTLDTAVTTAGNFETGYMYVDNP